jgi:hypothetical protein
MLKAPEPSVSPNSSLAEDDDDDTNPNNEDDADGQPPHVRPMGSGGSAFHSFAPKAQGVLFKISPLSEKASADIEAYVREGTMNRDLIYVDTLYGIVAPSQSREYSMFWESPWVEEQIKETGKKRKILEQQRTMAVRSIIKASASAAASQAGAMQARRMPHPHSLMLPDLFHTGHTGCGPLPQHRRPPQRLGAPQPHSRRHGPRERQDRVPHGPEL